MSPNRGVSRGDRGGVWGCCGVVLSYNFLPESKTYIPVRWAFHLREPSDIGIHISQWNQSCAFIWAVRIRIRLAILPPKLPPKEVGTVHHRMAFFCTHGTKTILSLGTQYHQTQQNSTLTHKFWISHNPDVAGSSPVSATNKSSLKQQVSTSFFLHYGKSGNKLVTLTPKWPQNDKTTAPGRLNFSTARALFVDKSCGVGE